MAPELQRLQEIYPHDQRATLPLGLRVNDVVYATGLAGIDLITGKPRGDVRQQTALALEHLRALVERAGASLDNVARAVAFCTSVEDRNLVDKVWMSVFPDESDKPAFKVLLADLPPGQRVSLDALALPGRRRERIDIASVSAHDPAVKVGDWLFSSRCHGNDPATGEIVAGGVEPEARQTLQNLSTLVRLAGGSEDSIVQITTFGRDPHYLAIAKRQFEAHFPDPARRPVLNQLVNFVSSRMSVAMEMVARIGGEARRADDAFRDLYLDPVRNSMPAGARIGPVVLAPRLLPLDPANGKVIGSDMEDQLRAVLQNMDRLLGAAGCDRRQVARVTFAMRQVRDRAAMNRVYREWYPDEDLRPPNKYVPAELPDGIHVGAQIIAVPGAEARAIEIPGIHHGDWMSMGGLTGRLVTSSRIVGSDPETGAGSREPAAHTANVFRNAERLLELAGGSWDSLQQATAFIGSDALREPVLAQWRSRGSERPGGHVLHFVESNLANPPGEPPLLPRLEIIAIV